MLVAKWFVFLGAMVWVSASMACRTPDPPSALPLSEKIPASIQLPTPQTEHLAPLREADPQIQLVFEHLEATSPEHITLYFVLQVDNSRSSPASLEISQYQLTMNGLPQHEGVVRIIDLPGEDHLAVGALSSARFPLGLLVDVSTCLGLEEAVFDTYQARFEVDIVCTFVLGEGPSTTQVSAEAVFPRIRAPKLTVTTIAVNQGELINTRVKVGFRIDNPNTFPVELASLAYEFYGDEYFWAAGMDPMVRHIPAQGSIQTQVLMVMNFIDMNRKLLEDVLAAKRVYYRFTGEAAVLTTIAYLPRFSLDFNLAGNSVVMK
ncbi:MAG: LEA type 2 family protein [Treponema sp.]|nr:LEA type 2 family protein [Treponema sp.]